MYIAYEGSIIQGTEHTHKVYISIYNTAVRINKCHF